MASDASSVANKAPWRRSLGPVRRMANSETLICSLAPRIMAKPELSVLHQPRLSRSVGFKIAANM